MFLQEKVRDINARLRNLENCSRIVVWGAGFHTSKLFERTDLFSYPIKVIVDASRHGNSYFGFIIRHPRKIDWSGVDAVVVSAPNKEKEIREILIHEIGFSGKIITLYEENECTPFYSLYDEDLSQICFLGDYSSWEKCLSECEGFDDTTIINKVISATQKVLDGSAVWERDSVLFYEPKYVYQICAIILKCAVQNDNQGVRVLDVGGALGSTYWQNRNYLEDVKNLEYVIAEQEHYAAYGHANLENDVLKFISSEENYEDFGPFDIVLISGSLQYIRQYKEIIAKVKKVEPRYIMIDRIMVGKKKRICKEIVPETIYKSSFPLRIFLEEEIETFFGTDYTMIEKDISSLLEKAFFSDGKAEARYYVFKKSSLVRNER